MAEYLDLAFFESRHIRSLIVSTAVLATLLLVRRLGLRALLRNDLTDTARRRIVVDSRNAVFLIVVLVMVFIWAQEIRSLAISAFAIAAAIVIATKELIMCLSGAALRARSDAFKVGDRIEVGAVRGDVIDQTLLVTVLAEIGPGQTSHQITGRKIVIPNSLFLTVPVVNETFTEEYLLHVFTVPVAATDDWRETEQRLLQAADTECAPYIEEAREHFESLRRRHSLAATTIEPRVQVRKPDPARIDLVVRMPVPARSKGRVEQAVLRAALPSPETASQENIP